MKEWLTEPIITKLEDVIDVEEGLASLAEAEGTMLLLGAICTRRRKGKAR